MFVYQFECLARNHLGYDAGMTAIADDPIYDEDWRRWIRRMRSRLGTRDLSDFIYVSSEAFRREQERVSDTVDAQLESIFLFGEAEGRIARANRGKDPLYLFAALQRQLGYPQVPRPKPSQTEHVIHPVLEQRLQHIEKRLKLLEAEEKSGIDLSEFYSGNGRTPNFGENE